MLAEASHRSFPPPNRPWMLCQGWRDLLFAHWSCPAAAMRAALPPGLALDTYDGRAWLGLVPFRMHGVHLRGLPGIPGASNFLELNVRTYVTVGETPGVYFFSLDAESRVAIWAARASFKLPYYRARMSLCRDGETVDYKSVRTDPRGSPACFEARYSPTGPDFQASRGSLEYWLTERYALFSVAPDGRVLRGDVHHPPWPLRRAQAEITQNTMFIGEGIGLERPPESLLYSPGVDVATWTPRELYRPSASRQSG
jgi:uncharacterized protein YqjF (DUF2071 family)